MTPAATNLNIPSLHFAIERLHRVFGDIRPGSRIGYHQLYEIPAAVEHRLLTLPLRALSAEDLGLYVQAVTSLGRPVDPWWPYFVPRILELIADHKWPHPCGTPASLDLLHGDNDWRSDGAATPPLWRTGFSADRVKAIDDFAANFWRRLITSPYHCISEPSYEVCARFNGGAGVGVLFDLFAGAGVPVARLLKIFDETCNPLADTYVAGFVCYVLDEDLGIEGIPRFCRGYSWGSNVPALRTWLRCSSLGERLATALSREVRAGERMLLGRSEALLRVAGRSIGKATGGRGSDSAKPPGFDKVSPVPFCPELA